jgi:preprotein translocase subunit SecD
MSSGNEIDRRTFLGVVGGSIAVSAGGCVADSADSDGNDTAADGDAGDENESATGKPDGSAGQQDGRAEADSQVKIVAGYPADSDSEEDVTTEVILTAADIASVDSATSGTGIEPSQVPIRLTEEGATRFVEKMITAGFTDEGIGQCTYDPETDTAPKAGEYCLYTVLDGEYIYGASMSQSLADNLENEREEFLEKPEFVLNTSDDETAQELESVLRDSN